MTEIRLKVKVYKSRNRYLLKIPKEFEPLLKDKKEIEIILITDGEK